MPEEKKQDIPLDLQAYQARNLGAFPNPEAFQTAWFNEGYGPSEGLVTFICHEDTPKGPEYYLAGYPITGYEEEPVVKEGLMLPVSPDILKLTPEERDKVAGELDEFIFLNLREGYTDGVRYSAFPYNRISDPDIRAFAETADKKICQEMPGNGKRYIDKYDEYYRKLANALLDHEDPKFGIERIAASLEQAAPICHAKLHNDYMNVHHDTKYVVQMLDDVLQKRGASKEEQDALAAYKKSFHAKTFWDYESKRDEFFCRSATPVEIRNGLSARLIKNDFPELPKDAPCYTVQVVEMAKERLNHCVRQDSADGKYIPLNLTQGIASADHVFLDGKPRKMGRINRPEFSARQAVLLHCMENPDLAEKIDWQNPQVCANAASITALCKVWENISDDMVSQKNDYPTLSDFRVTESGKVESEMPLYAISKQRDEPRNADEKEGFEKEFWHLGDRDYRIRFSGSLDDAKNMDEENVSVNYSGKQLAEDCPLPEDKRFLLLNVVEGNTVSSLRDYVSIRQDGDSYSFQNEARAMKPPASDLILDYEKSTGAVTLESAPTADKESVCCSYVPRKKVDAFLKKHTAVRKGLKKDPAYKQYQKGKNEEIPF